MDRILIHMIQVSYPKLNWSEILPTIKNISPSSVKTIAVNLEQPQNLSALLEQLLPEFAPLTLHRCCKIAKSNGNITLEEQKVLSQIAIKFDLDISKLDR
ncbi:MAG: hypothetical protein QNJ55_22080 [Xenococcus sp. MO_188.B8]|nr:hypothetical protein [Xenococcus sp. MO_188.B8]